MEGGLDILQASRDGHTETVKLLLDSGANIEEKDNDGKRKIAPGLKERPAGLLVARNFVNHRVRYFLKI